MGHLLKWLIVCALAAGCALLGLALPPISLSDYTTAEALTLGLVAAAPVPLVLLAIASMVPTERESSTSALRRYVPLVLLSMAISAIVACGALSPTREGLEPDVLARVESCEVARDAVGAGFRRKLVGLQSSSVKKNRRPRWTTFDVLVEGPRSQGAITVVASGIIDVEGYSHDAPLVLLRADLAVGPKKIDLLRCGEVEDAPVAPRTFDAVVREAEGASVRVGDACTIASGPGSNPYNCRFVITCGGETLYGATDDLGYAVCGMVRGEGGAALVAKNELDPTRLEGIPLHATEAKLDLDERERRAILRHDARASTVVIAW